MAAKEAISRAPLASSLEIVTDSRNVIGWRPGEFKRNNPIGAALLHGNRYLESGTRKAKERDGDIQIYSWACPEGACGQVPTGVVKTSQDRSFR
jgi:hypothetical protein